MAAPQTITRPSTAAPAEIGRLSLRLFGTFELERDGVPLPRLRSRIEQWLLAYLALNHRTAPNREHLAGLFWMDSSGERALGNLRRSLSNLRDVLGDDAFRIFTPSPGTISLDLDGAFCDVTAFDAAHASGNFEAAVQLYRGPLLERCDKDWAALAREAREQAFLAALERLAALRASEQKHEEAAGLLRRAISVDPFRETAVRALMEALAAEGDLAGANLVYRSFRLKLREEMRTEPAAETSGLLNKLRLMVRSDRATEGGHRSAQRLHVPYPSSSLIGRRTEIAEIKAILTSGTGSVERLPESPSPYRLVTLTGAGGVGKTRLALGVAQELGPIMADGVWFVDLSPIYDSVRAAQAIASTISVRLERGRDITDQIAEFLRVKKSLLILDNCEQVQELPNLVASLLRTGPVLRIVATSRTALGVPGELAKRVPSLEVPPVEETRPGRRAEFGLTLETAMEFDSIRLFVERAMETSANFLLSERNIGAIARICRTLNGIPLAVELAAARVRVLSVEQIAVRLNEACSLLTSGSPSAPTRQQTLRALIDWSYGLLSETEKEFLARLSVFSGGWTLEAARVVGELEESEVLDRLSALIDKSLVTVAEGEDGEYRYRLLETIRQYAAERLREGAGRQCAARLHRDYFLVFMTLANDNAYGPQFKFWLDRTEREHDNIRAALEFSIAHSDTGSALAMAGLTGNFWRIRGYHAEGREWLNRALAMPEAENWPAERARALCASGFLAVIHADFAEGSGLLEESLRIYRSLGDLVGAARVLMGIGNIHYLKADYSQAGIRFEESLASATEANDDSLIATLLDNLGNVSRYSGDHEAAERMYSRSLAMHREAGDVIGIAYALAHLGQVASDRGNHPRAMELSLQGQELLRQMDDPLEVARGFTNLADIAYRAGDMAAARAHDEEALSIYRELGYRRGIAISLSNLASLACTAGDYARTRNLSEEALSTFKDMGAQRGVSNCLAYIGSAALGLGDVAEAARCYSESLRVRVETGDRRQIADSLEDLAHAAITAGSPERAAILLGAAEAVRGGPPPGAHELERRTRDLEAAAASVSGGDYAAAWERGKGMSMEEAAAFALDGGVNG